MALILFIFSLQTHASTVVTANVQAPGCVDKELVQLIVIKKDMANQFLYQVGVPHAGSADFNFIPGEYRIEAISDKGCFDVENFIVKENQASFSLKVELKK